MTKEDKNSKILDSVFFPRLTEEQCHTVHEACLEIIEHVGVRLDLDEARDLLIKAGARIDENNLIHVPSNLIERALATAPKKVVLYDRDGNPAIPVEGHRCFYGPGSDCLNIIDHRSGKRREPLLKDMIEGVALCDSLSNIDFVMSMLLPSDVDKTLADRYQMEAMLSHTIKPIIFVSYEFQGCIDCVEMAEAAAGGPDELRRRPNVVCYINVISGLHHNKEALQKLFFLTSKNLPIIYAPSSTAGVTSPVTPVGSLALDYAGVLVGLVLSQLKSEGTPVIVSGMPPGHLDMRTMVSTYCEPERGLTQALAHYYDLPMFSLGGASESKTVDQQAGAEAALSLMAETLAGGNLIHDLGYLESGLTFSFSQLVICDEIVNWIKGFGRKFDVSGETLGRTIIAEVGPNGQYLNTEHTLKHYRERWYPELFERETYNSWLEKGGKSMDERSAEKVEDILAKPRRNSLSKKMKKRLQGTIKSVKSFDR
ncbi:MAG: trimethylamine methyltransferase family protein [Candidatus Aminicenantes bacterium]|nr:MAG: trimethylamine methyltransferase family protein [Candidatus Aminicenantes bacterium]